MDSNSETSEANDIMNPFVKAMKDQRLDFNYITALRREVINLIEPFRVKTLETAEKQTLLEQDFVQMKEAHHENKISFKKVIVTLAT
jgi:hypothetical protein